MLTAGVEPTTAPAATAPRPRAVHTAAGPTGTPAPSRGPAIAADDGLARMLRRAVLTRSILARTPAYRNGGKTAMNLTPRDPQDVTASDHNHGKLGLSCTETPGKGLTFPGGKASIAAAGFVVEDDPTDDPLHFLVRPGPDQGATLKAWAAQRASTKQAERETWHPLTARLWALTDMKDS